MAISAALKADLCEIYTDVDGVYTADPRICPAAKKLKKISYEEMLELASVSVSENIIQASWQALVDSIDYKLMKDQKRRG